MKWTDYTTKETLEDNDELMILDKGANASKRTLMDKIWDYVVDKMTTAVIAKLETTNKTLIGAVNELNSKSRIIFKDVTIKTEKDNYVVFASSKEYQLAIPVIINHEKFRNSIDIVSIDSTDWIIYSNVSQRVTIRMYLLNAS